MVKTSSDLMSLNTSSQFFDNQEIGYLLTVKDLATKLQLSENGVRKLARRGAIPTLKVGNKLRFKWESVLAAMRS